MELHDMLDDRQPQSRTAQLARARPVDPVEPLGKPRYVGRRDAFTAVGDRQLDAIARLLARWIDVAGGTGLDRYAAVAGRVFDRVVDQIDHHLVQAVAIALYLRHPIGASR